MSVGVNVRTDEKKSTKSQKFACKMKLNVLMMIAMVVLFFSSAESQTTINESIIAFNDYTPKNQNTREYKIDNTSRAEAFNHSKWDELLQKHVNEKRECKLQRLYSRQGSF